MEARESINDSSKLVAQAREILINCNIDWENEDIATVVALLEQALEKLTNNM